MATFIYASSQGQRTHSARTNIEPETETLAVLQTADLGCDNPIEPSRARDYGILRNFTITKPQLMYSGDAAEALACPVTGPAHQWERRCGDQERQERPCSQWEERQKRKDGD